MKVFFYQRNTHRKRQRETVEYCPSEIEIVCSHRMDFVKDTVLSVGKQNKKLRIKSVFSRLVPLNIHKMPRDAKKADYIYTWGCIPLSNKQYILEMDNPYCICYYNMFWFRALKLLWKSLLLSRRCKAVVCISEACKKSLEIEFGRRVANKARVVYPYMENNYSKSNYSKSFVNEGVVEYLFVSTQFFIKGGRETIEAFRMVYKKKPNIHLTMVTRVNEVPKDYRKLPFVTFIESDIEKKILHDEFFSKADVFILPSYQDSFGMVYLEALSFGLPIIATKMFAIPEMVVDKMNGILVDLPIHCFRDDYRVYRQYIHGGIIDDILSVRLYDATVSELTEAINCLTKDEIRHEMSRNSKRLFDEKFALDIRNKAFIEVFK